MDTYVELRAEAKVEAKLHDLRVFLRFAVASQEAARKPKDFGGLGCGLSEQRRARECMYGAQLHFGGPALASAGLWTTLAVARLPFHGIDEICPCSGCEVESTVHRLWHCEANAAYRHRLDEQVPWNRYPEGLPTCLARCGLIPANLDRFNITMDNTIAVQQYLLEVNALATQALADHRSGRPVQLVVTPPRAQPIDSIYKAALPPLRKRKAGQDSLPVALPPRLAPDRPQGPPGALPELHSYVPGGSDDAMVISCDGSYAGNTSGWGFTVAQSNVIAGYCGPDVLDVRHDAFVGAARHSNNNR